MATQMLYRDASVARPLRWYEAFPEYVPLRHRALARRHMLWLPIALLALLYAMLCFIASQWTAFIDEALYINVGNEYLDHWFGNGAAPSRGGIISGVPFLYPVIAASIDWVGGLWLVRAVSCALMITTMVLVAKTTTRLVNYRAGVLAAAVLTFCGPFIFLGQHATHDAFCVTLLAGAAYLGVAKGGWKSAVVMGALMVAAVAFKYTGAIFVPAILGLVLFTSPRRRFLRTTVALLAVIALGAIGLLTASDEIVQAVYTTTIDREGGAFGVIAPASHWYLLLLLRQYLGIFLLIALFGLGVLAMRSWRLAGVALILLTTAAILPVSHMMLGELSSYEKHLGWSAVFLAPLAGAGLERITRTRLVFAPVLVILALLALQAEKVSEKMVYWGNVKPVIEVVEKNPLRGTYLAVNATIMAYHTADDGYDIKWLETYDFWDATPEGEDAIVAAVENKRFARVVVRGDETGNPAQNRAQAVLILALLSSTDYTYETTEAGWRIFTREKTNEAGALGLDQTVDPVKKIADLEQGDQVLLQRPNGESRECVWNNFSGGGFSLIRCGSEQINVHTRYLIPQ